MPSFSVLDELDAPTRARADALVEAVVAVDDHPPFADPKMVGLHTRGPLPGFAVLAESDGALTGLGVGFSSDDGIWNLQETVHPIVRASGLREQLAERSIDEARARGGRRLQWYAVRGGAAEASLAHRLGFAPWREVLQMRRPLPPPGPAEVPEGFRLRAFVPGRDEEAWVVVNRGAFAAHPDQRTFDEADLRGRMAEPWFNAEDFLVAEDDEGMAGFCWVKVPDASHGEIYIIGVDPRCQGSGLGRALVLAGLARMVERRVREARLYVDGRNEPAIALYDSLGFSLHHVDRAYAADVR